MLEIFRWREQLSKESLQRQRSTRVPNSSRESANLRKLAISGLLIAPSKTLRAPAFRQVLNRRLAPDRLGI